MTSLDHRLVQFVMTFVGVGCIVVSVWNVPKRAESEALEEKREELRVELDQTRNDRERTERRRGALATDPHYREVVLQRLEGGLAPGDRPLDGLTTSDRRGRPDAAAP